MTTTDQLIALTATALINATDVGTNVFYPRCEATWDGSYPVIFVQAPNEHKESLGRNVPQFTVTATIRVTARVSLPAQLNEQGAHAVEAALWALKNEIEVTVINASTLMPILQQFPTIDAQIKVTLEGKQPLGEIELLIAMEFYQGPEDFAQPILTAVEEMTVDTDLTNVYDPTGTYADPPFPNAVNPAPRTSGPDGRNEGAGLTFNLPQ